MPLDQVIISYVRQRSWISVLLLRSLDLLQPGMLVENPCETIEVSPNGICFSERHLEYRIVLDEFFELAIKSEEGEPLFGLGEMRANNVSFGLDIQRVNYRMMEQHTVDVKLGELPLRITAAEPCSLHCSNCANEIIGRRQYLRIQPVPVITMRPYSFFCGRYKIPVYPPEEQLFYGLNYLVICIQLLGNGLIRSRGRRRLQCSRCRQIVGEILGQDVAVQLFADALRVMTGSAGDDSPVEFREIFGHVTATQMMMRLLHDAEPINPEKTRLLLKAVRPDGQLHFLQMLVDTHQLHLFRSQLPAPRVLESPKVEQNPPKECDTSSESGQEMEKSDTSSSSISSCAQEGDTEMGSPSTLPGAVATPFQEVIQPPDDVPKATVSYVELRGFRGCRMKYLFSGTDQELADNHEILEQWREEGARVLRVSYPMIMELVCELNANENMVAALEKNPAPSKSNIPRLSYIIYETDKDFYDRQLQPLGELNL